MDRVTVFLRTALFSFGGDRAHVPSGATVIEGAVVEQPPAGLLSDASRVTDDRGTTLREGACRLLVPWSKIDHVHVDTE